MLVEHSILQRFTGRVGKSLLHPELLKQSVQVALLEFINAASHCQHMQTWQKPHKSPLTLWVTEFQLQLLIVSLLAFPRRQFTFEASEVKHSFISRL